MIAGDHKTIIEKDSDFAIKLKVTDGVGLPRDLTDFDVTMTIRIDIDGTVNYVQDDGSNGLVSYSFTGDITDAGNGELEVVIDRAITINMLPVLSADALNIFSTEYNYHYTLDLIGINGNTEDIRVLRGRLAIRV